MHICNIFGQGSTLTVVLWPQASKEFPKWPVKKDVIRSTGAVNIWGHFVNKFPLKNVPNVFEINDDEIDKNNCCLWILCNVFLLFILKKNL